MEPGVLLIVFKDQKSDNSVILFSLDMCLHQHAITVTETVNIKSDEEGLLFPRTEGDFILKYRIRLPHQPWRVSKERLSGDLLVQMAALMSDLVAVKTGINYIYEWLLVKLQGEPYTDDSMPALWKSFYPGRRQAATKELRGNDPEWCSISFALHFVLVYLAQNGDIGVVNSEKQYKKIVLLYTMWCVKQTETLLLELAELDDDKRVCGGMQLLDVVLERC